MLSFVSIRCDFKSCNRQDEKAIFIFYRIKTLAVAMKKSHPFPLTTIYAGRMLLELYLGQLALDRSAKEHVRKKRSYHVAEYIPFMLQRTDSCHVAEHIPIMLQNTFLSCCRTHSYHVAEHIPIMLQNTFLSCCRTHSYHVAKHIPIMLQSTKATRIYILDDSNS